MPALVELHAAYPFWIWGGLAAALLAVEVLTGTGWLLWAAASAMATAIAAQLAGLSPAWAIMVFAVLTIVSTLAARRYLPRAAAGGGDINDNVARLVGRRGRAASAFERGLGRVIVDGKEWAAELDDGETLAAGASVEVASVSGATLRVRATA